jgi:hypothetical protein
MTMSTHLSRKTSSPVLSPLGTGRTRRQRARPPRRSEIAERARAEVLRGSAASVCGRVSVCGGSRELQIGEGRGDTGRTYIFHRREVYPLCACLHSWNAPPSARWSCASTNYAIQSAPDAPSG